ncbi:MAG: PadR family transcriptional regulator [Coriobacteriia bacterium]|nr:PadR family transcriptional regulator [Coriobacteriia bacterium]
MSLEYAILGFLHEEELSGYDLKTRCFDARTAHAWTADQAQIYRTLERLQKRRLVATRTLRQAGRPDRHVFRLTPTGRDTLADWLAASRPLPAHRDPFLLQIMLAEDLSDETLGALLTSQREQHQERLDALRATTAELERSADRHTARRTRLHRMSLDSAMAQTRAAIDWIDDCLDSLEDGEDSPSQRTLFGRSDRERGSR